MKTIRLLLEEKIQSKHLLDHSFYQRWQKGELSQEELKGYAKEYYQFESQFPRYISALHTQCPELSTRQVLLQNLIDEEQGEENHPELWLRFAEGLGIDREKVKDHFHSDETQHLNKTFEEASKDLVAGLAALYAYERQQPDVVRQKIDGLKSFYGLTDERSVKFFKVHQTADIHHAEWEAQLLEKLCQDDESKNRALVSAQKTLDALYDFLDGVERRYQPAA